VALDFAQPVGANLAPMVSRPLAGFTPRFKGNRWNFPPIGLSPSGIVITVGEAKVLDGGTNSNVLNGEWLAVPYPNYTGKCRGALDIPLNGQGAAGLRALILANASRKHEVSVTTHPTKRMTDPALYPTGVGGVTFEFAADRIRIRNITGATWAAGSRIVVKLDLSDYLMGFAPGTASPAAIPLLVPGVGSQGRVSEREGLWAHDDFFGVVRPQATARGAVHF
jgi:hypothetical protein